MMLFLTMICGQDYKNASKMNSGNAIGLQSAFMRFINKIMGSTNNIIGENVSKEESIQRVFNKIPPPEEWF